VLQAIQLQLTGIGPHEACISAGNITIDSDEPRAVIHGCLVMENLPVGLPVPLVVQYDTRIDPTAVTAPSQYRLAFPMRSSRIYEQVGDAP
jgi:hypothetical protein